MNGRQNDKDRNGELNEGYFLASGMRMEFSCYGSS